MVENSFGWVGRGGVKTEKTSLSARINIWINPGFLMQSEALAIPSAQRRLLDELSKPPWLKEINWNPPTLHPHLPTLHFLLQPIQKAASSMRWRHTHV